MFQVVVESRYVDVLEDEFEFESEEYRSFERYHGIVPDAFREAASGSMTLDQLTDAVNSLGGARYTGASIDEDTVELAADIYDRLGIISSEERTFDRTKIYRAPDYHGKGNTSSWEELEEKVDEALKVVERRARQKRSTRGLQMTLDQIEECQDN